MTSGVQVETERLLLRCWEQRDLESFTAMNADSAVMRFFPAPFTREESERHFKHYIAQFGRDGFTMYAAECRHTGAFLGIIGMQRMHIVVPNLSQPAIEIGWRLSTAAQGKGLATEGAGAVMSHAFRQLHIAELVAITTPANKPSRHVMEKLGMTYRPELTFNHPTIPLGEPCCEHVLYSISNPAPTEAAS